MSAEPMESAALVPPVRRPPTAVGADLLPPDEGPLHRVHFEPAPWVLRFAGSVRRFIESTLDVTDQLADEVASALGLRDRPAPGPTPTADTTTEPATEPAPDRPPVDPVDPPPA